MTLLPTGFDRLSANADNGDANAVNQDPRSPKVGKKTIGITVKRDFMCSNPETKKT